MYRSLSTDPFEDASLKGVREERQKGGEKWKGVLSNCKTRTDSPKRCRVSIRNIRGAGGVLLCFLGCARSLLYNKEVRILHVPCVCYDIFQIVWTSSSDQARFLPSSLQATGTFISTSSFVTSVFSRLGTDGSD